MRNGYTMDEIARHLNVTSRTRPAQAGDAPGIYACTWLYEVSDFDGDGTAAEAFRADRSSGILRLGLARFVGGSTAKGGADAEGLLRERAGPV